MVTLTRNTVVTMVTMVTLITKDASKKNLQYHKSLEQQNIPVCITYQYTFLAFFIVATLDASLRASLVFFSADFSAYMMHDIT